jgi:hypothetical protein
MEGEGSHCSRKRSRAKQRRLNPSCLSSIVNTSVMRVPSYRERVVAKGLRAAERIVLTAEWRAGELCDRGSAG